MRKSALGLVLSLCSVLAAPAMSAQDSARAAPSAKKQVAQNKSAAKRKGGVKARSVKTATVRSGDDTSLDPKERLVRKVIVSHGKRKVVYQRVAYRPAIPVVPPVMSAGDLAGLNATRDPLALASNVALVVDQSTSQVLFEKNSNIALPIASLTKLMTALVVVEARQNMDELLEVTADDIDREKNSGSRLRVGAQLTRANMLHIALMSSENRAASALGRHYPGGFPVFVAAMNAKARALGMTDTHYVDATGLSSQNVASARDLAKLVAAAYQHPLIREYSTDPKYMVDAGGHLLQYFNSNRLVTNTDWEIGLQKTGYISEAGRCLVMQARIEGRPVVMVFLDSKGKQSRLADASRIRKWLESSSNKPQFLQVNANAQQS
ncbi:D-alanyl-D-alanine endopeptidase [Noviherbaspirillum cavernae]|uniref:D-alanyl-D-alanine endopeptidase n=1 Tax=Noviherbaspirillum cavernae TaxID=2320862 RepID=A0A418WZ32_9BURK|nr:D-alanyl-D-alanine endopeptidase [Noviherbaspirillum cavernae]RJG05489.1 D-alanyl-D-alanine endopeptidase [Noviherbaspirillum cavernae]